MCALVLNFVNPPAGIKWATLGPEPQTSMGRAGPGLAIQLMNGLGHAKNSTGPAHL